MHRIRTLACCAVLALAGTATAEEAAHPATAQAVNAEQKAAACAACHGASGVSTQPTFPTLAGQHKSYLKRALQDYKAGKRKNPVMGPQAANLSDAEIEALATYFSKQKGPLYTPALK